MAARPGGKGAGGARAFFGSLRDDLIQRACKEITLAERDETGASTRDHLQSHYRQTGRLDPLLDVPAVPSCMRALWEAYCSLVALRRSGMGVHPLTWTDIQAWAVMTGQQLDPWEVETLLLVEASAMKTHNELAAKRAASTARKR